mmetsp:Transcript_3590/g.10180  ORF Transcript_3590/g.10180 Transcript_3590/m.10180 type:complete len:201 (+) Transcript_3590:84-686(+)
MMPGREKGGCLPRVVPVCGSHHCQMLSTGSSSTLAVSSTHTRCVEGSPHVCEPRGRAGSQLRFRIHRGCAAEQTCRRSRDPRANSAATGPRSMVTSCPDAPPQPLPLSEACRRTIPSHTLVEPSQPVTSHRRPKKSTDEAVDAARRRSRTRPAMARLRRSGGDVKTSTSERRSRARWFRAPLLSGLKAGPPSAGVGLAGS